MNFLDRYNAFINRQNWDHLRFIQYLIMIMVLILLLLYIWVIILTRQGLLDQEYLVYSISQMTKGIIFGGISGIVVGFVILLPYYQRKIWDEHFIVSNFLWKITIISVALAIIGFFVSIDPILRIAFLIGFIVGELMAVLAYIGEIVKEHKDMEQ